MKQLMEFYVAKCRGCGVVTAACVDKPEYAAVTAKNIQAWINRGALVEHVVSDRGMSVNKCRCTAVKP